jgi:hypothetical protein
MVAFGDGGAGEALPPRAGLASSGSLAALGAARGADAAAVAALSGEADRRQLMASRGALTAACHAVQLLADDVTTSGNALQLVTAGARRLVAAVERCAKSAAAAPPPPPPPAAAAAAASSASSAGAPAAAGLSAGALRTARASAAAARSAVGGLLKMLDDVDLWHDLVELHNEARDLVESAATRCASLGDGNFALVCAQAGTTLRVVAEEQEARRAAEAAADEEDEEGGDGDANSSSDSGGGSSDTSA